MSEQRRFATSFLVGLLSLPLAAAAATALVASNGAEVAEPAQTAVVPAVTAPAALPPSERPELAHSSDPAADLDRACGAAGLDLVEREALGELSELEQAALTALRSVCETEGTPLPAPPAPEPVIRTVTVEEVLPAGSVVALSSSSAAQTFEDDRDDHDSDDRDDDDHDEHDDD